MGSKFSVEVVFEVPTAAWINEARKGNLEALGFAFEKYRAEITQAAASLLAENLRVKVDVGDLVQETYLEAYRDFSQFDGKTGAEWKAWLKKILQNNIKEIARRYETRKRDRKREVPIPSKGDGDIAADATSPSGLAMRKERSEAIRQALERLPERDRLVIYLRSYDQCTFEVMGGRLGCSAVAARNRWVSAVERLWRELGISSDGPMNGMSQAIRSAE
ncbi:sigma-70 family RNA polymerase sigma factor [Singulisphaera sp. PoT]|uniref:sigma-70 family RNA polymerase sigma factor n=1 Tax=Singulisphaera sp. PoT TaxID=3411797 RepID=UPI003BF4EB3A